jgi:hypothetical protein
MTGDLKEIFSDQATFPVLLYSRDTGWMFRDVHTHGYCVRYLDFGAHTTNSSREHGVVTRSGSPDALTCGVS